MVDVCVERVELGGPMQEVEVPQGDFQMWPCPICRSDKDSIILSEVLAHGVTSMVSAYCVVCEHRYFQKMPSVTWLNRYYSEEFDAGLTELTRPRRGLKDRVKRLPGVEMAWTTLVRLIGREEPGLRQIRAFLEGIIETNGSYYEARPDIQKVLEVGCGYGGKLKLFRRLGYESYGVEASRQRADECRKEGLTVFDCPITDLGQVYQHGPFDFVYSIHVLEHIADVSTHLAQLTRLIRAGGMLYIQVPNIWQGETLFMQSHAAIHCHTFSVHSLAKLLNQNGFTTIRILADNNLHILAAKTITPDLQPSWKDSAAYGQLLECLSWVRAASGGHYRLTFDHAQVQVMRTDDNELVYKRDPYFSIQRTPYRHNVEFSMETAGAEPTFPIRFIYERSQPPVWIKRQ